MDIRHDTAARRQLLVETHGRAAEFGAAVGASAQAVRQWRRGRFLPRREMMESIEEATGGRIPVAAWFRPA